MCTQTTVSTRESHLSHVIDPHDDQPTFEELRAARIDDCHSRPVALDRLGDRLIPDGVSGEVEVVEEESADGSERLRDRAAAVARGHAHDAKAFPGELIGNGTGIESELEQRLRVIGLAEDRHVARSQLLAAPIEVIAVLVGDEHRVEAADDVPSGHRQAGGRIADRVARVLDWWPDSRVVEHRIDE
jgi:hypothetical protein